MTGVFRTIFLYEKGAFTGATRSHRGVFEKAEGGTIFLDEIGTIDEKVQIRLLRLLETRMLERIGGIRIISATVRIIVATNEILSEAVDQGRFREDLFFRLDIFQIALPPVRERGGDVALLVNHFLKQFSDDYQRDIVGISPEWTSPLRVLSCQSMEISLIPSTATSFGQMKFWVNGDYTPIKEYI